MAGKGSILYIDQNKEIRDEVNELMAKDFNLHPFASLNEAEGFLKGNEITGMLIDGMFKQEELLDFIGKARAKGPKMAVAVWMPVVDLVLEPEFKKALEKHGVKVVGKTDVCSSQQKIWELFDWCCGQNRKGEG